MRTRSTYRATAVSCPRKWPAILHFEGTHRCSVDGIALSIIRQVVERIVRWTSALRLNSRHRVAHVHEVARKRLDTLGVVQDARRSFGVALGSSQNEPANKNETESTCGLRRPTKELHPPSLPTLRSDTQCSSPGTPRSTGSGCLRPLHCARARSSESTWGARNGGTPASTSGTTPCGSITPTDASSCATPVTAATCSGTLQSQWWGSNPRR